MATITLTIPDNDIRVLNRRYNNDVPGWLLRVATAEAADIRNKALRNRLPQLLDKPAFQADLAALVAIHDPTP